MLDDGLGRLSLDDNTRGRIVCHTSGPRVTVGVPVSRLQFKSSEGVKEPFLTQHESSGGSPLWKDLAVGRNQYVCRLGGRHDFCLPILLVSTFPSLP